MDKIGIKQLVLVPEPMKRPADPTFEPMSMLRLESKKRKIATMALRDDKNKRIKNVPQDPKSERSKIKKNLFPQQSFGKFNDESLCVKKSKIETEIIVAEDILNTVYDNIEKRHYKKLNPQSVVKSTKYLPDVPKIDGGNSFGNVYGDLYNKQNLRMYSESIGSKKTAMEFPANHFHENWTSKFGINHGFSIRSTQVQKTTSELVNNVVDEVKVNLEKVLINLKDLDTSLSSKDRSKSRKNRSRSLNKILERQKAKKLEMETAPEVDLPNHDLARSDLLYPSCPKKYHLNNLDKNKIIEETEEKEEKIQTIGNVKAPISRISSNPHVFATETDKKQKFSQLFEKSKINLDYCKSKNRGKKKLAAEQHRIHAMSMEKKWTSREPYLFDHSKDLVAIRRKSQYSELICEYKCKRKENLKTQELEFKKLIEPINTNEISSDRLIVTENKKIATSFHVDSNEKNSSRSPRKKLKNITPNSQYKRKFEDIKKSSQLHRLKTQKNYLKNLSNMLKSMTKKENPLTNLKLSVLCDKRMLEIVEEGEKKCKTMISSNQKFKSFKPMQYGPERNKVYGTGSKLAGSGFSYQKKLFPNATKVIPG